MPFENLTVSRAVIHQIYQRGPDNKPRDPRYGAQISTMTNDVLEVFRSRITDALGSASQSMQMQILQPTDDCAVSAARRLNDLAEDAAFATASRWFPDALTRVQSSRRWPGGIVVVFDGTVGHPGRKFIGIIKSEMSNGLRPTNDMQIALVSDLFLGEQIKLYKIGVFLRPVAEVPGVPFPDGWSATVYDANISGSDRNAAARYFYETFLGCIIPADSAALTKKFYGLTKEFIKSAPLNDEKKSDLYMGLYSYLKVDQTPTIEVATFSRQFFEPEMHDDYATFMASKQFPMIVVQKDISDIAKVLVRRKVRFSGNIILTGPAHAFRERVKIETVDGPADHGLVPKWTQITVKDRILAQE